MHPKAAYLALMGCYPSGYAWHRIRRPGSDVVITMYSQNTWSIADALAASDPPGDWERIPDEAFDHLSQKMIDDFMEVTNAS
jgi:hypothetical protein